MEELDDAMQLAFKIQAFPTHTLVAEECQILEGRHRYSGDWMVCVTLAIEWLETFKL